MVAVIIGVASDPSPIRKTGCLRGTTALTGTAKKRRPLSFSGKLACFFFAAAAVSAAAVLGTNDK